LSYLKYAAFPRRPEVSFEDWVVNRFGRRLFEIFFRAYTEKVWGVPCAEISADWASQRIKGLSLPTAIMNALWPKHHGTGGQTMRTLIDSFRYPRLGPGMMWELARDRVVTAGGSVEMGKRVTAIRHNGHRVLEIEAEGADGRTERIAGSHFISSMPLRDVMQRWEPAPPPDVLAAARALTYRDLVVVALVVRRADLFPDNWIYIHDPSVKVGRIQNFRAWSPDMVPDRELTCLGLEYFCSEGDAVWTMSDPDLLASAGRELAYLGLVGPAEVEDGAVVRTRQAYPVYDPHYEAHVRVIRQYLEHGFSNFQVVGRNGMHKYNNQDHSMMTALLAARNVLGGRFDVWRVNTDAEYYEEDAVASEAPSGSRRWPHAAAKRSPHAGRSGP
jgi:protoporphyrinogen oxidase